MKVLSSGIFERPQASVRKVAATNLQPHGIAERMPPPAMPGRAGPSRREEPPSAMPGRAAERWPEPGSPARCSARRLAGSRAVLHMKQRLAVRHGGVDVLQDTSHSLRELQPGISQCIIRVLIRVLHYGLRGTAPVELEMERPLSKTSLSSTRKNTFLKPPENIQKITNVHMKNVVFSWSAL